MKKIIACVMAAIALFLCLKYDSASVAGNGSGSERYTVPFEDIMGMDGFCEVEFMKSGWSLRTYCARIGGDGLVCIAEGFGNGPEDDYVVDIDGDGVTELVCNCICGGDGNRQVLVFKLTESGVMKGHMQRSEETLPGLYDWGVNAVQSFYDPQTGMIDVLYSEGEGATATKAFGFGIIEYEPFDHTY